MHSCNWPPHVIIINRKKHRSRIEHVLRQLDIAGLCSKVTVLTASEPEDAKNEAHHIAHPTTLLNIANKANRDSRAIGNWNQLACALSHIRAWKLLGKMNLEEAIIVEDDIVVDNIFRVKSHLGWLRRKRNRDRSNESDKLFCVLGARSCAENIYRSVYTIDPTRSLSPYRINGPFCGMHFYMISRSIVENLYQAILPLKYQIDVELGHIISPYGSNLHWKKAERLELSHSRMNLYIFEDNSVVQIMKYGSDVQPWNVPQSSGDRAVDRKTLSKYVHNGMLQVKKDLVHVLPSKYCVYLVMSYCGCAQDMLPGVFIR